MGVTESALFSIKVRFSASMKMRQYQMTCGGWKHAKAAAYRLHVRRAVMKSSVIKRSVVVGFGLIDNYYGNFIAVFGALFERALYDHKGHSHMENCSRVNRCGSCLPTTPAPARPSWRDF
jgi:hypothetical protein